VFLEELFGQMRGLVGVVGENALINLNPAVDVETATGFAAPYN
jgi:hypothetical protein